VQPVLQLVLGLVARLASAVSRNSFAISLELPSSSETLWSISSMRPSWPAGIPLVLLDVEPLRVGHVAHVPVWKHAEQMTIVVSSLW
jgi:hypothetical protein